MASRSPTRPARHARCARAAGRRHVGSVRRRTSLRRRRRGAAHGASDFQLPCQPRAAPPLLAQEQAFLSTLKATLPESVTLHSEYLELTMFDQQSTFEEELVTYLVAKYARTKLDLVVVVASNGLRFALRHRARLFAGVPIVFTSVDRQAAADVVL